MNKTQLVKIVADKTSFKQKEVNEILNAITETIGDTLVKKESVTLVGFGTFTTLYRDAKNMFNPSTGSLIKVDSTTLPKFKAAKNLKDKVGQKNKS